MQQRRNRSRKIGIVMILFVLLLTACQTAKQNGSSDGEAEKKQVEESVQDNIPKQFTPVLVKDIEKIRKMRLWLEYFYYNNIFDENLNNETGEISEDAMISFAASYIMQIEHKGLRFDTDTFRLYIPKKTLEEVVFRFFGYQLEKHRSISKHGILFAEDNYVIQAEAREWPTRLDVISVTEIAPNRFVAILNGNNTEVGEIEHQVKAEVLRSGDRYILRKYQMITDKSAFVTGNPIDTENTNENNSTEGSDNISNPDNGDGAENPDSNKSGETVPATTE